MLSFDLFALFRSNCGIFARCMTKYTVEITETLSRIIEIDADSEELAVEQVRLMYQNCDIILEASDYIETEISVKR